MFHLGKNIQVPVLYSFRRCPYAMRARLAIHAAQITVEHREILLREKAPEFLETSPKGTVPVIVEGRKVIEESLDVMLWALSQNDPEHWLATKADSLALIAENDNPFKQALDRYKYPNRYENSGTDWRREGSKFLAKIDSNLAQTTHLLATNPTLADYAIFPFIRQFANTDRAWFDAQPWPNLHRWLAAHLASPRFEAIMTKYPKWSAGDAPTLAHGSQPPQS